MTSCETQEPFTDDELQRASVYSEGDQFSMATNYGDTLTFTVEEKMVEKRGKDAYGGTYQVLTYELSINSMIGGQHNGQFYVRSLADLENVMNYNIWFSKNKNTHGGFDMSEATETIIVNGVTYHNANCNQTSCFSMDKGFLKFTTRTDTLVLLP